MDDTRYQSAHFCGAGFSDFSPESAVEARLLRFSNRFTAYSFYAIEMKLGRMILGISPHSHSESDFPVSPRGAVGALLSKFSNRFTTYSIYDLDSELHMMIPSYRCAKSI